MAHRPASLPASCSKFGISDSGEEPVNLRRSARRQLNRFFNNTRVNISLRRSDSTPNLTSALSPERPITIASSTVVSPERNGLGFDEDSRYSHRSNPDGASFSIIRAETALLTECQNEVIRFYRWCLTLIGWCPVTSMSGTIINILWSCFIVLCLFMSYTYQVFVCQWDRNWQRISPSHHHNSTAHNTSQVVNFQVVTDHEDWVRKHTLCKHLVSIYLFPNFLHFITYVIGCWHFRTTNEQIEALVQKFFLCYPSNSKRRFIRNLRFYFYFSFVWAAISVLANLIYDVLNGYQYKCLHLSPSRVVCHALWVIEVFGNFFSFNVTSIVAFNFAALGEILIANISGLLSKLEMRSIELRDAIKDINNLKVNVAALNSSPSIMMSILIFIMADLGLAGAINLTKQSTDLLINVYFIMFVCRFLPIACFPILQVVRVNQHCSRLLVAALDVRANGYRATSQLDRDSFLLFILNTRFTAKLFRIGFRGAHVTFILFSLVASFIVLTEMNILKLPSF